MGLVRTLSVALLLTGAWAQTQEKPSCTCVFFFLCPADAVVNDNDDLRDLRVREGNCAEMEVCCTAPANLTELNTTSTEVTSMLPPVKGSSGLTSQKPTCGLSNPGGIGFRVLGEDALFGEYPWMVAVTARRVKEGFNFDRYLCGGSLIHPKVVLTAAHCIQREEAKKLRVRAGEWDALKGDENLEDQSRDVINALTHPNYNSQRLFYDVALLEVESPFELVSNVATVCLPTQDQILSNRICTATGWGKNAHGDSGKNQEILQKVDLPLVSHKPCEQALQKTRLGPWYKLHHSFVCAGGEVGKDTCQGDGGSPLFCPIDPKDKESRFVQIGIVSWGIGCGTPLPGVYASVASVRTWIDNSMIQMNLTSEHYTY